LALAGINAVGYHASVPIPFPRTDKFIDYPTAIEIAGLRAHTLAIDETFDATGIEGKVV
jgi:hypothetical protein